MASTTKAAETLLQHIDKNFHKCNMPPNCGKLPYDRYSFNFHINGTDMAMQKEDISDTDLRTSICADGGCNKNVTHRIISTWITVAKLKVLWKKPRFCLIQVDIDSCWCSCRFHLLYGLRSVSSTGQDCAKLDAFQYWGRRATLNIKHPYWPRIMKPTVPQTANTRTKP